MAMKGGPGKGGGKETDKSKDPPQKTPVQIMMARRQEELRQEKEREAKEAAASAAKATPGTAATKISAKAKDATKLGGKKLGTGATAPAPEDNRPKIITNTNMQADLKAALDKRNKTTPNTQSAMPAKREIPKTESQLQQESTLREIAAIRDSAQARRQEEAKRTAESNKAPASVQTAQAGSVADTKPPQADTAKPAPPAKAQGPNKPSGQPAAQTQAAASVAAAKPAAATPADAPAKVAAAAPQPAKAAATTPQPAKPAATPKKPAGTKAGEADHIPAATSAQKNGQTKAAPAALEAAPTPAATTTKKREKPKTPSVQTAKTSRVAQTAAAPTNKAPTAAKPSEKQAKKEPTPQSQNLQEGIASASEPHDTINKKIIRAYSFLKKLLPIEITKYELYQLIQFEKIQLISQKRISKDQMPKNPVDDKVISLFYSLNKNEDFFKEIISLAYEDNSKLKSVFSKMIRDESAGLQSELNTLQSKLITSTVKNPNVTATSKPISQTQQTAIGISEVPGHPLAVGEVYGELEPKPNPAPKVAAKAQEPPPSIEQAKKILQSLRRSDEFSSRVTQDQVDQLIRGYNASTSNSAGFSTEKLEKYLADLHSYNALSAENKDGIKKLSRMKTEDLATVYETGFPKPNLPKPKDAVSITPSKPKITPDAITQARIMARRSLIISGHTHIELPKLMLGYMIKDSSLEDRNLNIEHKAARDAFNKLSPSNQKSIEILASLKAARIAAIESITSKQQKSATIKPKGIDANAAFVTAPAQTQAPKTNQITESSKPDDEINIRLPPPPRTPKPSIEASQPSAVAAASAPAVASAAPTAGKQKKPNEQRAANAPIKSKKKSIPIAPLPQPVIINQQLDVLLRNLGTISPQLRTDAETIINKSNGQTHAQVVLNLLNFVNRNKKQLGKNYQAMHYSLTRLKNVVSDINSVADDMVIQAKNMIQGKKWKTLLNDMGPYIPYTGELDPNTPDRIQFLSKLKAFEAIIKDINSTPDKIQDAFKRLQQEFQNLIELEINYSAPEYRKPEGVGPFWLTRNKEITKNLVDMSKKFNEMYTMFPKNLPIDSKLQFSRVQEPINPEVTAAPKQAIAPRQPLGPITQPVFQIDISNFSKLEQQAIQNTLQKIQPAINVQSIFNGKTLQIGGTGVEDEYTKSLLEAAKKVESIVGKAPISLRGPSKEPSDTKGPSFQVYKQAKDNGLNITQVDVGGRNVTDAFKQEVARPHKLTTKLATAFANWRAKPAAPAPATPAAPGIESLKEPQPDQSAPNDNDKGKRRM